GRKAMDEKNLDLYGNEPIPWSRARDQLESDGNGRTFWLATIRPDGRPHVAGVGGLWDDGKLYFMSGEGTRKSRNLSENSNSVVAVPLPNLDLVIEGRVARVTDRE